LQNNNKGKEMKKYKTDKLHIDIGGGRANVLLSILVVAFAAALLLSYGYVSIKDHEKEAELRIIQQDEIQKQLEEEDNKQAEKLARKQREKTDSFYQKLSDGFDVNILIVGDSIGAGAGASANEKSWAQLLKEEIVSKYKVNVNLANVSMGGNTSYAGYARTMTLNDEVDYDLVVICYGQNDRDENFGLYYESIIRAIRSKYSKPAILCMLESSQREYTGKMETIKSIAAHYGLPVVDTIAPFVEHYDELSVDGVHPNDLGQTVYFETVMQTIEPLVENKQEVNTDAYAAIYDQADVFDACTWYSSDDFTREGNTFTLKTNADGEILGIDYTFVSGENHCKIFIDGVEYAAPEVSFDYDFSQRHIMVVNDWLNGETIDVKDEIKVVFDEGDDGSKQADGFMGIMISGQNK
jgi:lysophospholipase L1-like esterase